MAENNDTLKGPISVHTESTVATQRKKRWTLDTWYHYRTWQERPQWQIIESTSQRQDK